MCSGTWFNRSKNPDGFLKFKDRGSLFKPTKSVLLLCLEAEKCFQRLLFSTAGKLPQCRGVQNAVSASVLEKFASINVFLELHDHMKDCAVENNHVFSLVKAITKCYCKIRFHHLGKRATSTLHDNKIRKKTEQGYPVQKSIKPILVSVLCSLLFPILRHKSSEHCSNLCYIHCTLAQLHRLISSTNIVMCCYLSQVARTLLAYCIAIFYYYMYVYAWCYQL